MVALLVNILGALVFLFIFWKKLKEDYTNEIVFSSAFLIILGIIFGYFVSWRFFPLWFFWIEGLGAVLGLGLSILKFRVRLYETLESLVIAILPWLSLFFLLDSVTSSSLVSFIAFLVCLVLVFIYYFLDLRYKSFSWYKSGRIGFSGLATLGTLFLIRASIAIFFTGVLSFTGVYERFISGIATLVVLVTIFNLAKKEE